MNDAKIHSDGLTTHPSNPFRRFVNPVQQFYLAVVVALQLLSAGCALQPANPPLVLSEAEQRSELSPDLRFGELFTDVQLARVFEDSKTFVDSTPRYSTEKILTDYHTNKHNADFDLGAFVEHNFVIPPSIASDFKSDSRRSAAEHINVLWDILTREPDQPDAGSLIPLPYPYVVPGGRFREIYYWDSYFTMLGLQAAERVDLIEAMVNNFSYLIDTMGFIPNGNRSYYQSRSQPPFYSLMVELLAQQQGQQILARYRPQLLKEYEFWMDGKQNLSPSSPAIRRVVRLQDGSVLNRYWDDFSTPRPESYREDVELAEAAADKPKADTYRHIRAAAESGWDFSSRWFADSKTMASIHTTDIIPVDLNALLYNLERVLAAAFIAEGIPVEAAKFTQLADDRRRALMRCCWNQSQGFFRDYDYVNNQQTNVLSLAAVYPLFFKMVEPAQAQQVAKVIARDFLQAGGVTTSLNHTGEQWDAPNGWAPLQWITIQGLRNYQHHELAETIKNRWITLNTDVYQRSGKMVEKYNVYTPGLEGGGGEYPVQDGFGWTNGVLLKLLQEGAARK